MMAFAGTVSRFVEKHPTFKMLALSFLLLIGVVLVADGLGNTSRRDIFISWPLPFVEFLNLKVGRVPLARPAMKPCRG
jgi:predicted tellurium resistance membrane protein TerC